MKNQPDEIQVAFGKSSLGWVLVAQSSKGICGVMLSDDRQEMKDDLQRRFPNSNLVDAKLDPLVAEVVGHVERPSQAFEAPLDLRGTEFQRRVWQALCKIPVGSTTTYTDLARRLGMPNGARAVARACATNAVAVIVPCHRVVRGDGSLAGYRWGIERKRRLLERER
jgi:AraC family transcriptional regulator of adaptative response/methylated-DNA-[protein]-cysteine methyltransferase